MEEKREENKESKMKLFGNTRKWFNRFEERTVLWLLGLIYSNSLVVYVLSLLVNFLTDVWKLKLKHATAIMNIQGGLALIMQIPVSIVIDTWLGHYWMLLISNVIYCIGLGLLTWSVPELYCKGKEKGCASKLKASSFYWALALIVLGKAGQGISLNALSFNKLKKIKLPESERETTEYRSCCCIKYKFVWKQTTEDRSCCCIKYKFVRKQGNNEDKKRRRQIAIIKKTCFFVGVAGGLTGIFGVSRFDIDWSSQFRISACIMAFGGTVYLLGRVFQSPAEVIRSALTVMRCDRLAAFLKRRLSNYEYNNGSRDQNNENQIQPTNDFQCKDFLRMFPISATFLFYGMVKSISDTFCVEQANAMDRSFGFIFHKIPVPVFFVAAGLAEWLIKPLYWITFGNRIKRTKGRYAHIMKIGLGMLFGLASCCVASEVESRRLKALREHPLLLNNPDAVAPVSVFWIAPQFILIGVMDGLACDGMEDFFTHVSAVSVRRYGLVFTQAVIGLGKIFNTLFIMILDKVVVHIKGEDGSWFADTVNGGHLDYVYRSYVAVGILNLIIFSCASYFYPYRDISTEGEEKEEEEPHQDIEGELLQFV